MGKRSFPPSGKMYAAFTGTILVAVCCFTPILVILLGVIGLSSFTPYLDFVLIPALMIMVGLSIASYSRWRKAMKKRTEAGSGGLDGDKP